MDYFRKTVILKQIQEGFSASGKAVSGICRLEIESGVCTLFLSTINLAPVDEGEYFACVLDSCGVFCSLPLGKSPLSVTKVLPVLIDLYGDVSVGISFIKDDIPLLIAYANSENKCDHQKLKKRIIDKCLENRKKESVKTTCPNSQVDNGRKENTPPCERAKIELESSKIPYTSPPESYNDEVVATENYYFLDADFNKKLEMVEKLSDKLLRNENDFTFDRSKEKKEKDAKGSFVFEDETGPSSCQNYSKDNPFFLTVKDELEDLFNKFERETPLENTLKDSKWVRIYYSENKFYVVGIIYFGENKLEKYICYGVPSKYSLTPPKELRGFCSFLPLSIFDVTGDGYWIMFQDAVTGECVKKPR